jgi:E3 ubiquitin-protein ligase RNF14
MPDNPYRHFNDLKSTCYMRLWELEGGDGDQAGLGIGYAGGANWEDEDSGDDSSTSFDSDDDDNFEDFDGDGDFIHFSDEEDDSSDEEPAPDQRPAQGRDVRIEIVNFARAGGAANRRIFHNIPRAVPPPAPIPPHRAPRGRRDVRQPVQGRRQPQAGPANLPRNPGFAHGRQDLRARIQEEARDHLEEHDEEDVEHEEVIRAGPAPGQGRGAAQQPAPLRAMGLERFLELAQRDQEDEWDSDELNE